MKKLSYHLRDIADAFWGPWREAVKIIALSIILACALPWISFLMGLHGSPSVEFHFISIGGVIFFMVCLLVFSKKS